MRCLLLLLWLPACQPEVPNRACAQHADCFTQEVCVEKQCVTARGAPVAGDAQPDAALADLGLPDVALPETEDAGGDAAP